MGYNILPLEFKHLGLCRLGGSAKKELFNLRPDKNKTNLFSKRQRIFSVVGTACIMAPGWAIAWHVDGIIHCSFSVTRGQWREGFPSAVCAKSKNVDLNLGPRSTKGYKNKLIFYVTRKSCLQCWGKTWRHLKTKIWFGIPVLGIQEGDGCVGGSICRWLRSWS